MSVRAKFKCVSKTQREDGDGFEVKLEPVVSGSAENESFFRYTPWGNCEIGTINESAAAQFDEGAEYYLDFTKA